MNQHQSEESTLPHVAIVILNWNNAQDTIACLDAVAQLTYPYMSVLVVDNGSSDDSVEQISASHPKVTLVPLGENYGYTGGNNRGIELALEQGCDYVWLLNDDAVVAPDSLSRLMDVASVLPIAGILGPKIYTCEERQTILSAGGTLVDGWRVVQHGVGQPDEASYDKLTDVDFIMGCAMLVNRHLIEQIGMFEEGFFAYEEDVEWCYRAKQSGFRVLYVPQAHVWHPDTRLRDEYSPRVVYYMARNKLLFVRKHRLGPGILAQVLLQNFRTLASWSLRMRWRNKRAQRDALALALWDFFRKKAGRCEHI